MALISDTSFDSKKCRLLFIRCARGTTPRLWFRIVEKIPSSNRPRIQFVHQTQYRPLRVYESQKEHECGDHQWSGSYHDVQFFKRVHLEQRHLFDNTQQTAENSTSPHRIRDSFPGPTSTATMSSELSPTTSTERLAGKTWNEVSTKTQRTRNLTNLDLLLRDFELDLNRHKILQVDFVDVVIA